MNDAARSTSISYRILAVYIIAQLAAKMDTNENGYFMRI